MYGLIVGVAMLTCDIWPECTHAVSRGSIPHRMVALHALIMAWQASRLMMSLLGSIGVADVLLWSRDLAPSARR